MRIYIPHTYTRVHEEKEEEEEKEESGSVKELRAGLRCTNTPLECVYSVEHTGIVFQVSRRELKR